MSLAQSIGSGANQPTNASANTSTNLGLQASTTKNLTPQLDGMRSGASDVALQAQLSESEQPAVAAQQKATKPMQSQPEDEKHEDERQQALQESSTNLIINYIPPNMNEGALGTLFSPYGTMQNIKIVVDLHTGRSRGYGFVKYESAESAKNAQKALNGYNIGGKKLKVAFSRPQSKEIQNSNLYVTHIPMTWDNDRLRQVFSQFGYVVECRILVDPDSKSRGVGFVRMDNHVNALKAIEATRGYRIDGEIELVVKLAQKKNPTNWEMNDPNYSSQNNNHNYGMPNPRNNVRRPGGFPAHQNINHMSDTQLSRGFYNKRGPFNRRHYYRRRNESVGDMHSNAQDNFYPPSYDSYAQPTTQYYSAQGMRESGVPSNSSGMNTMPMETNANRSYSARSYNIVVRNLPEHYNVDHLIKLYAPYGPIQSVHIQKPPRDTSSKSSAQTSYGVVSYFFEDSAKNAIEQTHGRQEDNCQLHVTWQ